MPTHVSSLKKIKIAQITLIYLCIFASLSLTVTIYNQTNRLDPQIITLDNYINKQIHEYKTNIWKQHHDKTDYKHNPHSLWAPWQNYATKNYLHNKTEAFTLELKQPSLI